MKIVSRCRATRSFLCLWIIVRPSHFLNSILHDSCTSLSVISRHIRAAGAYPHKASDMNKAWSMQVDLDSLDQNKNVNKAGRVVGQFAKAKANQISDTALQPYDEVFGLQRFRETELIHGRCVSHVHALQLAMLPSEAALPEQLSPMCFFN